MLSVFGPEPSHKACQTVAMWVEGWQPRSRRAGRAGGAIESWRFRADATGPFVAGQAVVGIYGPNEPYPAQFGDDQLMIYGMIGFEVDVTERLIEAMADPNVTHVGFRWISNTPDGYWTSMDPAGYLPTLSVDMKADEPLVFVLTSSDTGPVTGDQHSGRPYHVFNDANDEAVYLTAREWTGSHSPESNVSWPRPDGILEWDVFADPNGGSGRPEVITYDAAAELRYAYWDAARNKYVLLADETDIPEGLAKLYYEEWSSDLPLSLGNYGRVPGATATGESKREFFSAVTPRFGLREAGQRRRGLCLGLV